MRFIALSLAVALAGCGSRPSPASQLDSRSMSHEEALEDFDAVASALLSKYGPKEYKERRFGYKVADNIAKFRAEILSATTDAQYYGIYKQLLTTLHDGHVSIAFNSFADNVKSWSLPVSLGIIEGKVLVDAIDLSGLGDVEGSKIKTGDLLVSIDGQEPLKVLETIKRYETAGNDETDKLFINRLTNRPAYIPELAPTAAAAHLAFADATGHQYTQDLTWRAQLLHGAGATPVLAGGDSAAERIRSGFRFEGLARQDGSPQGHYVSMGETQPFFVTDQTKAAYHFATATPDAEHLAAFGLTADKAGKDLTRTFAALYRYNGKTILLVRQPDYEPADAVNSIGVYKAILSQYESLADVLVIDQTHNPGGSMFYALNFFRLFNKGETAGFVQANHADRKWIEDYRTVSEQLGDFLKQLEMDPISADAATTQELALRMQARAKDMEGAYDAGKWLAPEEPLYFLGNTISPATDYSWSKPVLVLADDLAGSCGDIFPMMMKRSGTAKIFGKRTIGLGGNVDEVATLPNSGAVVRMTRGLYTTYRADGLYSDADKVENNGVLPDLPYEHTLADYRAGFVGYVKAFSDAAAAP